MSTVESIKSDLDATKEIVTNVAVGVDLLITLLSQTPVPATQADLDAIGESVQGIKNALSVVVDKEAAAESGPVS